MTSNVLDPPQVTPVLKRMTDEQFLEFQASRPEEELWQLVEGIPFMMTPATDRHQTICKNLNRVLDEAIDRAKRRDVIALCERGLIVPSARGFRPTADVAIHPHDDGGSYHDVFFLAAEVLSNSNTEEHIERKRQLYMQHPKHVLVISQFERKVEHWARSTKWQRVELTKKRDAVDLPEFKCRSTLGAALQRHAAGMTSDHLNSRELKMSRRSIYAVVLIPDDFRFRARVPALPEVNTQGVTREACLDRVTEAIEVAIELRRELGEPVPAGDQLIEQVSVEVAA